MSKFSSNQNIDRYIHDAGIGVSGERGHRASEDPFPPSLDTLAKSRHRDSGFSGSGSMEKHDYINTSKVHKISHTCGREFLSIICSKCGYVHRILAGSRDRTCQACARQLYYRVFERYSNVISKAKRLKFLTLTWKPVKRQDSSVVREMGKALNRFMHRNPYVLWKGLLAVVECKKTRDGWFYYHIHCLYDGFYVPQQIISRDWKEISGFPIVWVKQISRTPKRALKYVLKYVLKGFSFDKDKDRLDFKASMKGVHYVRSFGKYYALNYRLGQHVYFRCPNCQSVKCWVVWDFCNNVDLFEGISYDNG